jgi:tRNA threonylcarbamoyladenosine biosynthesis protein TsaB
MKKQKTSHSSPLVLALETATSCGSVALVSADNCLAEYSLQSDLTHSRRLCSTIEQLMHETGSEWTEIDAVAVSFGPGSFTGLRIGLSVAKGMVLATGKSLIGISTLDGLASQVRFLSGLICPVLDARKKEIYTACYQCDEKGMARRISDYFVFPPERLGSIIKEKTVFLGDGLSQCRKVIAGLGALASVMPPAVYFPKASHIGLLAVEKYIQGDVIEPSIVTPIYVRPSEAEINFRGA